jgi:hypothetical protein
VPASNPRVTSVSTGYAPAVKAMFWLYFVMIWAGIVYFSVIGLTHH